MGSPSIRFGRFELQTQERRLLADGKPVSMGARAFDVLRVLVERPGHLVTKRELLDQAWAGLVVEENNLTVQISALRRLLGDDCIATIPGRGYRFTARVEPVAVSDADHPAATTTTTPSAPTNADRAATLAPAIVAPAPVHLVGRDDDIAEVERLLARAGVLTIAGIAGVGKTSVARAVAARHAEGVVWVDLAPLTDADQWTAALARALDARLPATNAEEAIVRAIGARLLIIDNAEHLVAAVALQVAALRQHGPALRILVTSQTPLAIAEERVFRLAPLALPAANEALDLTQGAAALFVARVQAADHRFRVTAATQPLVREICERLDGLPLALEMAAARVPALGLSGVRDALAQRFALLTAGYRNSPSRHRSLHAAIEWSHSLLTPFEQQVLRACGVFTGGFSLDLLTQVVQHDDRWAVIDALSLLVDRSLVAIDAREPPRYRLLDTLWHYARAQAQALNEMDALQARHAQAVLDLFHRAMLSDTDPRLTDLALLEHDNAREALAWARRHAPPLAVQGAAWVANVATFSPWRRESLLWMEACADLVDHAEVDAVTRAAWWRERARQQLMSALPTARASADTALALTRPLGDDSALLFALSNVVRSSYADDGSLEAICTEMQALLARHPEWPVRRRLLHAGTQAFFHRIREEPELGLEWRKRELEFALAAGATQVAQAVQTNIAAMLQMLNRHEEALAHATALVTALDAETNSNAAYAWNFRIVSLLALGRLKDARADMPTAAATLRRFGLPYIAEQFALLLAAEGQPDAAALMVGYSHAAHAAVGMTPESVTLSKHAMVEAQVKPLLGDAQYAALVTAGRAMDDAAADQLLQARAPASAARQLRSVGSA